MRKEPNFILSWTVSLPELFIEHYILYPIIYHNYVVCQVLMYLFFSRISSKFLLSILIYIYGVIFHV